jgi:hypothetical protein
MHTRYIASDEVKRFRYANRSESGSSSKSTMAKIGLAAVLVTGIVTVGSFALYSRKPPIMIEVDGSSLPSTKGFCAVKCRDGSGPFHSDDVVYVDDLSEKGKYRKKIYDKNKNLIVEGIGNDKERWFYNPYYKGEPNLGKAEKIGDEWYGTRFYTGMEAIEKWADVKKKF